MRRYKQAAVFALAAIMGLSSLGAFAARAEAGPLADKVNSGYDEATWAKLTDNVLEYDEVPDLVHEFNTTMKNQWDSLERTRQDLTNSLNELESARKKAKDREDSAKEAGDAEAAVNAVIQDAVLKAVIQAMDSSAVNPLSRNNLIQLQKAEKQITMYAQSALISYDALQAQRETLTHLQEMYDRQYELLKKEQELGMATSAQVLEAQKNQLSAKSNIESIDSTLSQLVPTICTLTGWPSDQPPQIARIPAVDESEIGSMNLEEDTRKAIGNNTQLQQQRQSAEGKTYAGAAARLAAINEGDQKLTIKMEALYQDVLAKQAAWEAAQSGYESAEKSAQSYDRMRELGMLSEAQYLGSMISFYQKQASYESANTSLRLAIETYQWAVLGLVNADS